MNKDEKFEALIDDIVAKIPPGGRRNVAIRIEKEHHTKGVKDGFKLSNLLVSITRMLKEKRKVKNWEIILEELVNECNDKSEFIDKIQEKMQ